MVLHPFIRIPCWALASFSSLLVSFLLFSFNTAVQKTSECRAGWILRCVVGACWEFGYSFFTLLQTPWVHEQNRSLLKISRLIDDALERRMSVLSIVFHAKWNTSPAVYRMIMLVIIRKVQLQGTGLVHLSSSNPNLPECTRAKICREDYWQ